MMYIRAEINIKDRKGVWKIRYFNLSFWKGKRWKLKYENWLQELDQQLENGMRN